VKSNKGAAGVDDVDIDGLREYGEARFLGEIEQELCNGSYRVSLVRRAAPQERIVLSDLDGAQGGDLSMSLIHTAELCGANSFDYLTELQRHAQELTVKPTAWMPWNYRETLQAAEV
jgi:hypothetical protein